MAARDLYINLRPDRSTGAFVKSHKDASPYLLTKFYRDGRVPLRIFVIGPVATGGLSAGYAIEDMALYTCQVHIGSFHVPLTVGSFVYNGTDDCFEGILDLKTDEMRAALGAATVTTELSKTFEVKLFITDEEEIIVQQTVTVSNVVRDEDAGDAGSVSDSLFADALEAALGDSNTLTWRRPTANIVYGDVPIMGAPDLIPALSLQMPIGTYAAPVETAVVLGELGQRYMTRLNVVLHCELSLSTGGFQKPGDHAQLLRGESVASDIYNRITLEVSSPPATYLLNYRAAGSQAITDVDYFAEIVVDAGATLTLTVDTTDPLTFDALQTADVTFESGSQLHGPQVVSQVNVGVAAHTGTLTETEQASVLIPCMGLSDRVRVALAYSRPASQVADALILIRHNGNLAHRQRVGLGRGGVIDLAVVSNQGERGLQLLATDSEADYLVGTSGSDTGTELALTVAFVLENVADTITLEALTVTKIPNP